MAWLAKLLDRAPSRDRQMAEALAAWNGGDYGVALDLWAPLAQAGLALLDPEDSGAQR